MAFLKGNNPAANLSKLLHGVIEYTDHAPKSNDETTTEHPAAQNSNSNPQKESTMSNPKKTSLLSGAAITTIVSLIALLFSGYSFYETVLKQPTIKLYAPPLIHMYRSGFRDVLAFPITLSNDGAKRGTVLSFDLEATNPATGERKYFKNLYFGNNPKDTSRIFTPMTIAGRSSVTDVVMFRATETGAFFKTTGGVELNLELKLTLNLDEAEFWSPPRPKQSLSFAVNTNYIQSFQQMEKGNPTVLYRRDKQRKFTKPAAKPKEQTPQAETPNP